MFSSRERLKRADFSPILERSRRFVSEHFSIVFSNKESGYAVIIPKKVVKSSVDRHRLKRQILEAMRLIELPKALIVFVKKIDNNKSMIFNDIKLELKEVISKINKS